MALVTCPDCGCAVSDLAEQCPSCARPMGASRRDVIGGRRVRTVERTAKRYKGREVFYTLCGVAGLGFLATGLWGPLRVELLTAAIVLLLVGGVGGMVNRAGIWWHHG